MDEDYSVSALNTDLMVTLRERVKECSSMDPITGLCRSVYRRGRLGEYEIRITDSTIADIETRLNSLGMVRDNGDAVIVSAILRT